MSLVDELQPTNLALKETQSIPEFNQEDEELARKREQVLDMNKMLMENA
jgi:hypothetical protein